MPGKRIESAKKALRQSYRRRKQNLTRKAKLKTVVKQFKKLLTEEKNDEAREQLKLVYKTLDKLAKVKFIKTGKAKRQKSRLAKKLK